MGKRGKKSCDCQSLNPDWINLAVTHDSENVLDVSDVDGEDVGDDDDRHEERHGEGDLKAKQAIWPSRVQGSILGVNIRPYPVEETLVLKDLKTESHIKESTILMRVLLLDQNCQ